MAPIIPNGETKGARPPPAALRVATGVAFAASDGQGSLSRGRHAAVPPSNVLERAKKDSPLGVAPGTRRGAAGQEQEGAPEAPSPLPDGTPLPDGDGHPDAP